jgi:hypothetical protein
MKRSLIAGLLCLIVTIVYAGQAYKGKKEVVCASVKDVIELVSGPEYQEQPLWAGTGQDSRYIMTINPKTGTWTMIQYDSKKACIISTGVNSQSIVSEGNAI